MSFNTDVDAMETRLNFLHETLSRQIQLLPEQCWKPPGCPHTQLRQVIEWMQQTQRITVPRLLIPTDLPIANKIMNIRILY